MADLDTISATVPTIIVGAETNGAENTPVTATDVGDMHVADLLTQGGAQGSITVGTSAIAARVGGSNYANRKNLTVFNNSNNIIYWGFTSGVTTSSGTPIFRNQSLAIDGLSPDVDVYLIAGQAGNNVRVTESG